MGVLEGGFFAKNRWLRQDVNANAVRDPAPKSDEVSLRWSDREWSWLQIRAGTCSGHKSADRA
jgi:hypothetical protein